MEILTVYEVAVRLNRSPRQVLRMIKAGKLDSHLGQVNGKTGYLIHWRDSLYAQLGGATITAPRAAMANQAEHLSGWEEMARNTSYLADRPLSDTSISLFKGNLFRFLREHNTLTAFTLELAMGRYTREQFGAQHSLYGAARSFAKYLDRQGITKGLRDSLKGLKPRRFNPEVRTVLREEQIGTIFHHLETSKFYREYDRLLMRAAVATLIYTGIRNSELCTLTLDKLNLETGELQVYGKNRKWRVLGINRELLGALTAFLECRPVSQYPNVFLNAKGKPLTRFRLSDRIARIAKTTGISITPHGMRRTFATVNAHKGRSVEIISEALGHTSLDITKMYFMTSQEQVVSHMKTW